MEEKDEKLGAIGKKIILWHEACMLCTDEKLLKEPRAMVGAILFFWGSIDNICQANNIDDRTFFDLGVELLSAMGFPEGVVVPIFKNFYIHHINSDFASNAIFEGSKSFAEFFSGRNKMASLVFSISVCEWAENPSIGSDVDLLL